MMGRGLFWLLIAALCALGAAPAGAEDLTRSRFALSDAVGVGSGAIFGPQFREKRWADQTFVPFYDTRFMRAYPLPQNLWRAPAWGRTRW